MAHMRYLAWAERAELEKFPNVGRLFKAISRAEQAHATGHFKAMGDVAGGFTVTAGGGFGWGRTSDNLQGAIDGELFEVNEMYPAYLEVAKAQKEAAGIRSMTYAIEAEMVHAAMYQKAKKAVDSGKDARLGDVQIWTVCGYTAEGGLPDSCPICKAKKRFFVTFACQ